MLGAQSYASKAKASWGLSYEVFGDPQHKLGKHLIAEGILPNLFINDAAKPGLIARQRRWISNPSFMSKYRPTPELRTPH